MLSLKVTIHTYITEWYVMALVNLLFTINFNVNIVALVIRDV